MMRLLGCGCRRPGGCRDGRIRRLGQRDDHDDRRHGRTGLFRGRRPGDIGAAERPGGVAVDGQGNVYIADARNSRVRKVSPGGTITTFAGDGRSALLGTAARRPRRGCTPERGGGGPAGERLHLRLLQQPCAQGQPRRDDHDVRRHGHIRAFPGTAARRPRRSCRPAGGGGGREGNVYIADGNGARVRKVSAAGTITTIAGTGSIGLFRGRRPGDLGAVELAVRGGGGQEGERLHRRAENRGAQGESRRDDHDDRRRRLASPGTAARRPRRSCRYPQGWRWTGRGTSTSPTYASHRVRKVSPGGTITTIAGTGDGRLFRGRRPGDLGAAVPPCGVAVDGQGNVYIIDKYNHACARSREVGTSSALAVGRHRSRCSRGGRCRRSRRVALRGHHDDRRHRRGGVLRDSGPGYARPCERTDWGRRRRPGECLFRRQLQQPSAQGHRRREDHDIRRHR